MEQQGNATAGSHSTATPFYPSPTSLETISFWSALSIPRLQFALPFHLSAFLVIFAVVTHIPGAIWAGALTPKITSLTRETGSILVPQYSSNSSSFWSGEYFNTANGIQGHDNLCLLNITAKSEVSSCPALDYVGGLLGSASSATSPTSTPSEHQKVDGSGWSYRGRSYGVGSSIGLVDLPSTSLVDYTSFKYTENGYITSATYAYNTSSNYTLTQIDLDQNILDTFIYNASGTFPNSPPGQVEAYAYMSTTPGGANIFVWSAVANDEQNLFAVVGNGWYSDMDQMQCSIQFNPSTFSVSVNMTTNIIEVSPMKEGYSSTDIEPTGNLTKSVFLALNIISQLSSNNAISVLGNAVKFNWPNMAARYPQYSQEELSTHSLEDSITAIIDNLLLAFGASQTLEITAPLSVPVFANYNAMRIGSDKYIFATLGIKIFLLLITVIETYRTRLWNRMTRFNFTDIDSVIVAASAGGRSISETCATLHKTSQISWEEDSGNITMRKLKAKLIRNSTGPVFVKAESQELASRDSVTSLKGQISTL